MVDYARPGDRQSRSMRGAEAKREAQARVDAGPTPAQVRAATPPPGGVSMRRATAPNNPERGPGNPATGGQGRLAGVRPVAGPPAPPAPRPRSRPAQAPRKREMTADELNDISLDLIRNRPQEMANSGSDPRSNIARKMGYAKGGLVRHTPSWSFGKKGR